MLKLVADGRTNRLIGEELGLSALTVKSHLARISRKLGTGDRAELVAISIRGGVLVLTPRPSRRISRAACADASVPSLTVALMRPEATPDLPAGGSEPPADVPRSTPPPPDDAPEVVMLTEPADGIPPVVETPEALAAVVAAFGAGTGPVAVDAERASGYRYGQRTYLVQLRREGAGTALIDPIAVPDLSSLSGRSWASSGCCTRRPRTCPAWPSRACCRAACSTPSSVPGCSAWNAWASRPSSPTPSGSAWPRSTPRSTGPRGRCPTEWLRYAALDVEVLVELREILAERLAVAGKAEWAAQEFEAVRTAPPPPPRVEPWRRVSGLHAIRDARRLGVVRELWLTRDQNARQRDISPGRVLPDHAIVAAAQALPRTVAELTALPAFAGKGTRRRAALWQQAIDRAPGRARQRPALGPRAQERRPAAAARLGREGPGRGRPARRGP